jgi:preprotein translocase subunit YajC
LPNVFDATRAALAVLAQTTQPTTKPFWARVIIDGGIMVPMLALLAVMWIFMLRGKKNEQRQREEMLGALKRGDRIQTIGGVLGTVVDVRDADVVVKVDESSNTKITFIRSAIHRVVTEKKAETK